MHRHKTSTPSRTIVENATAKGPVACHARRAIAAVACAAPIVLLIGCAAAPRLGAEASVGISEIVRLEDLSGHQLYDAKRNVQPHRLATAGLTGLDVAAGRLALVGCSPSVDAWWTSYAVLPPGLEAKPGQVVRIRVQEDSTNERLAINPVIDGVEAGFPASLRAYDLIPDWRERGLRNNYRKIALPDAQRDRYRIVQGSYGIAC